MEPNGFGTSLSPVLSASLTDLDLAALGLMEQHAAEVSRGTGRPDPQLTLFDKSSRARGLKVNQVSVLQECLETPRSRHREALRKEATAFSESLSAPLAATAPPFERRIQRSATSADRAVRNCLGVASVYRRKTVAKYWLL